VTNPLVRLPGCRPGSVRRTSSLAIEPAGDWDNGTRAERGRATAWPPPTVRSRRCGWHERPRCSTPGPRLTSAGGDLAAEVVAGLVGKSPVSGFRKQLARLAAVGLHPAD